MYPSPMYCSQCGHQLTAGAAFCSRCGTAVGGGSIQQRSGMHSLVIALALIFMFPLGVLLMWTSSDWDPDVKWAITGLLFPPLWLRFLWKVPWLPYAVEALIAVILANAVIQDAFSPIGAVAILVAVVVFLAALKPSPRGRRRADAPAMLRAQAESVLQSCHDLIADIEDTRAFDLAPAGSAIHRRYTLALEVRSEGAYLLEHARSEADVARAKARLDHAFQELRSVRDGLDAPSGG